MAFIWNCQIFFEEIFKEIFRDCALLLAVSAFDYEIFLKNFGYKIGLSSLTIDSAAF